MPVVEDALLRSEVSCYVKLQTMTNAWIHCNRELNYTLTMAHQAMIRIEPAISKVEDKVMKMKILIDALLLMIAFLPCYVFATSPRNFDRFSGGETAEDQEEDTV